MAKGTVKIVLDKGYGFISTPELEKDVFYHEKNLTGELATRKLRAGDSVQFDIEKNEKDGSMRYNAANITLVGGDDKAEDSDDSEKAEDTEDSEKAE